MKVTQVTSAFDEFNVVPCYRCQGQNLKEPGSYLDWVVFRLFSTSGTPLRGW